MSLGSGTELSNFHPASEHPMSALRSQRRRHATVTAPPGLATESVLDAVESPSCYLKQQSLQVDMLSAVQECPDEAKYDMATTSMFGAATPMAQKHSRSVQQSHTLPYNMTPKELLEGLADNSKAKLKEGHTENLDCHYKHPTPASGSSHPLSQQPAQGKRGYVSQKPTDSHSEMGVELVEWYTEDKLRQEGLSVSNGALWLPPIQSNTSQAFCLCANLQCCHSATARYRRPKSSGSYHFNNWSQNGFFMDFLKTNIACLTTSPLLQGSEGKVQMQAGTRLYSRLSYRDPQNTAKPPVLRDMMIVGHRV